MAFDAFLALTGGSDIVGESTRKGFEKMIEINHFDFSVENPTTIGSATGGAGAGKVKFNSFTIKKTTDSSSPLLYQACCLGAHFTKASVILNKASGDKGTALNYLQYDFETVFLTSMAWSGDTGGDDTPTETIGFVYGTLAVHYTPQLKTGAAGAKVIGKFSLITQSSE